MSALSASGSAPPSDAKAGAANGRRASRTASVPRGISPSSQTQAYSSGSREKAAS
jgi:hypothetical protein